MKHFLGIIFAIALVLPFNVAAQEAEEENGSVMKAGTFAGLELRGIGPALMSGRIADVALHPEDPSTWYVAVGSGGVRKTDNSGTTGTSICGGRGSWSMGCRGIDASSPGP